MFQHLVNARGLKCPMPVIKLQQQIRLTRPGEVVCIECTDSGALSDITAWCRVNKRTIVSAESTDFGVRILIEA
ncbi:sulfurtransferase TusA family protein [Thiomicrorhabdus aquaedulcis]|uniref:sulfurtransferase TusA family protein n=1 Tax=Thiomicrorhabdus aquaedulcis TaxID=2211106 RepID=UPI000FD87375|nr:sulfurtransferase TusA family protein [Thiomicrorhabdus aquaedulcis]